MKSKLVGTATLGRFQLPLPSVGGASWFSKGDSPRSLSLCTLQG